MSSSRPSALRSKAVLSKSSLSMIYLSMALAIRCSDPGGAHRYRPGRSVSLVLIESTTMTLALLRAVAINHLVLGHRVGLREVRPKKQLSPGSF